MSLPGQQSHGANRWKGRDEVCEILAVAVAEPWPFSRLHGWVSLLETYGLGGFGWGVAWVDEAAGEVRVDRGLGRYVNQFADHDGLLGVTSRRFLVHLRRPNKLSTVDIADTQPFFHGGDYAFCHNGFLNRAEALRPPYADRLLGGADSEVGWLFFQDRLEAGVKPVDALVEVEETFGGKVNLGYLGADATLAAYTRNVQNAMWEFETDGARVISTSVHSDDDSVFRLVFPNSTQRRLVPAGTAVTLGDRA
jgi:predicted glutamine amidotransferase